MLIGRVSANHPLYRRPPDPTVDDRATDPAYFALLDAEFHFTVDVAASAANTKCGRYYDVNTDGLSTDWGGERVYCNPPYSAIGPWVEKAWREAATADLIVMLLPANRTEQRWWQDLVEPFRDKDTRFVVRFLAGRLRFTKPGEAAIGTNNRPPFGCCLLVWGAP